MAVIKVFDSVGVKTVMLMGNLDQQPYDEEEVDPNDYAEDTDDGF